MGRTNLRLAAGAGVVATCLLVAGPVEGAAAAHPGDSQSDRSDNGHRSDNRGRGDSRDGSKRGNDNNDRRGDGRGERGRGAESDGRKGGGGNYGHNFSDNSNRNDDYGDDDRYTESDDGNGDKSTTDDAGQRSVSASSRSAQVATASLAPDTSDSADSGAVAVPTAPTFPVDQGGSDFLGTPSADPFTPPQVTFGNGRTPAPPESDTQPPRVTYSVPDVAPAPPLPLPLPPAAPVAAVAATAPPSWVVRIAVPTAAPQLVGVAPAGWADPLFGLTGLLLIPIAGAALGYRQARAAQHAKRFGQALPQA